MAQKLLEELSEDLAVDIYNIAKQLQINREFIISNQVMRSATSVGANISEAQFAQSKADFITKLRIALKEANETRYWLRVLFRTENIPHGEEQMYVKEAFDTNWVAPLGKNVDEFEKSIEQYIGVKAAAALNAGTAALHLAVKLAGVGQGDIVLCSDLTFSATVNPVSYEKGVQVFIDSERET